MTPEEALRRLQDAEVRQVLLAQLKTDAALQPRVERVIPFREQRRAETQSEAHAGTLRLALEASRDLELEPVLVANITGSLYVVDGHHRLRAYRLGGRSTVPARVAILEHRAAVLASKLVNCADRALEMHREQRLDAAWQYLAEVTHRGSCGLPAAESTRTISGRFGIGKSTVCRMLEKLSEVRPSDWSPQAHDPGTGFPRWRYVREVGAGWQEMRTKLSVEELTRHEAEKLAKRIGALLDKATPEAAAAALAILEAEERLSTGNPDTAAFLADIADPEADF